MGIFGSSEENIDQKAVDSTGHVNTNIVIQEAKDTHEQLKINEKMVHIMYVMCGIELLKLGVYLYYKFVKNIKKKYVRSGLGNQQSNS